MVTMLRADGRTVFDVRNGSTLCLSRNGNHVAVIVEAPSMEAPGILAGNGVYFADVSGGPRKSDLVVNAFAPEAPEEPLLLVMARLADAASDDDATPGCRKAAGLVFQALASASRMLGGDES